MLLLVGTPPISTQFLLSSGFYETSREARNFYRISRPTGLFTLLTAAAAAPPLMRRRRRWQARQSLLVGQWRETSPVGEWD